MSVIATALELHIKVTTQEEVNRLIEFTKPFKSAVYDIKEKFNTDKHFDIFSNWKLAGELSLRTINQHNHELSFPGLYCITWKGNEQDKTPFYHKSIYIGESTVSMYKRLVMFEGDWRGNKTNHSGKIYRTVNIHNLCNTDYNIWYRRHDTDGQYEGGNDSSASKDREAHALGLHTVLFRDTPLMNVRDTPNYNYMLPYREMRNNNILLEKIR